MTVTKWVHIVLLDSDPWVLPILAAIDQKGYNRSNLSTISLSISIKIKMIYELVERINREYPELFKLIKKGIAEEYIFTNQKEGYAFPLNGNESLKYNILIDLESLLFEINTCCEFIEKFIVKYFSLMGKELSTKQAKNLIIEQHKLASKSIDWYVDLDKHRNLFMHDVAPYLAVDVSNVDKYDILIMNKNLRKFDDDKQFIRLSQLAKIYTGFNNALDIIRSYLIKVIKIHKD
jgi:hypothetical protein